MKRIRGYIDFALILLSFAFTLYPADGMADTLSQIEGKMLAKLSRETESLHKEPPVLNKDDPGVKGAKAVHDRNMQGIMAVPEVVGTAVGPDDAGKPCILVFLKKEAAFGAVPENLEGVPVMKMMTGEIYSMEYLPEIKPAAAKKLKPTGKFPLPVPIGVSTGNRNECSAGTIGARLKSGSAVYALGNNHVYARENAASIGEQILQPGLFDAGCNPKKTNVIGTLHAFVPLDFSGGDNEVDAAIALSSTKKLDKKTPPDGYGTPSSFPAQEQINMKVQKYGRGSSLTKGVIAAINATVDVSYGTAGTARFVKQIIVIANKPFIKPGDSGSLLVTDDSAAMPVGLLFAGNSTGTLAVANPISLVLTGLGGAGVAGSPVSNLTVDGK